MVSIPEQLSEESHFIRLYPEEKKPVGSTTKGPFFEYSSTELNDWINDGGNVGLSLNNDLVVFDIDSSQLRGILDDHLPHSFTTKTGSGGYHRFFRCAGWTELRQFKDGDTDLGSLRSDSWQVVIPPSVHPNGIRYQLRSAVPIADISVADINQAIEKIPNQSVSSNTGGGGGGGGVGKDIPDIPERYPNTDVPKEKAREYLKQAGFLSDLKITRSCNDWSGFEFKLAKCLSDRGCSEKSIKSVLDGLHQNSKWHNRESQYRIRTVRKAIQQTLDDIDDSDTNEFVDFATDDMDLPQSESRKTDSGSEDSRNTGGENMSSSSGSSDFDFENKESLVVYEADSIEDVQHDDRVIKVSLTGMSGTDDEGERVDTDFVSINKGRAADNGEFGVSPEFNQQASKSIGAASAGDLRLIAEGIEKMAERIEK